MRHTHYVIGHVNELNEGLRSFTDYNSVDVIIFNHCAGISNLKAWVLILRICSKWWLHHLGSIET